MFDITDPFGTGRIRELEYSMKVQKAEAEDEIAAYQERAAEAAHVSSFLAKLIEQVHEENEDLKKQLRSLAQTLNSSEETRKGMAEKLRKTNNDNQLLSTRFQELSESYDQLAERYADKQRELEEIYAEHEALVREIRDSQHGTVAAEPEAMSA